MAPRARILAFGSATALVVAGATCGLLIGGTTGDLLAIGLVTVGLGAVLLLLFLEVGLSEEEERAREEARRRPPPSGRAARGPVRRPRGRRRPAGLESGHRARARR